MLWVDHGLLVVVGLCWLFCCTLFVDCCSLLSVVRCLLLSVVCKVLLCPLSAVRCSLFVVRRSFCVCCLLVAVVLPWLVVDCCLTCLV